MRPRKDVLNDVVCLPGKNGSRKNICNFKSVKIIFLIRITYLLILNLMSINRTVQSYHNENIKFSDFLFLH